MPLKLIELDCLGRKVECQLEMATVCAPVSNDSQQCRYSSPSPTAARTRSPEVVLGEGRLDPATAALSVLQRHALRGGILHSCHTTREKKSARQALARRSCVTRAVFQSELLLRWDAALECLIWMSCGGWKICSPRGR